MLYYGIKIKKKKKREYHDYVFLYMEVFFFLAEYGILIVIQIGF